MSSSLKTMLIAGLIVVAVALFAVQSAHAGDRQDRIPYVPSGLLGSIVNDGKTGYDGNARSSRFPNGSEAHKAMSAARGIAREVLGADLDKMLDQIGK